MLKKIVLGAGSALAVSILISGSALAATGPGGSMGTGRKGRSRAFTPPAAVGTVSAINGAIITLAGKNGTTYAVDDTNAAVMKNGTSTQASGIQSGDTLMVFGTASGAAITASRIVDGVKPGVTNGNKNGWFKVGKSGVSQANKFSGTVTAINGTSFTLRTKGRAAKTLTINDASAAFTKNGQSDASSDLAVNQMVSVSGALDSTGTTITATSVNIIILMPAIRFSGTVQSISADILTVLANNGTTYTVDATKAVVTYSRGHKGTLSIVQVNDKVTVSGKLLSGSVNVTAGTIRDASRVYKTN